MRAVVGSSGELEGVCLSMSHLGCTVLWDGGSLFKVQYFMKLSLVADQATVSSLNMDVLNGLFISL